MPRTYESPGALIYRTWQRLQSAPAGSWIFSRLVGRMVPYTGAHTSPTSSVKAREKAQEERIKKERALKEKQEAEPRAIETRVARERQERERHRREVERTLPQP